MCGVDVAGPFLQSALVRQDVTVQKGSGMLFIHAVMPSMRRCATFFFHASRGKLWSTCGVFRDVAKAFLLGKRRPPDLTPTQFAFFCTCQYACRGTGIR